MIPVSKSSSLRPRQSELCSRFSSLTELCGGDAVKTLGVAEVVAVWAALALVHPVPSVPGKAGVLKYLSWSYEEFDLIVFLMSRFFVLLSSGDPRVGGRQRLCSTHRSYDGSRLNTNRP
jgi:hypothetical protein